MNQERTVKDPDRVSGSFQSHGDGPHVATSIDEPFDIVVDALGCKTPISMICIKMGAMVTLSWFMSMTVSILAIIEPLIEVGANVVDSTMQLVEKKGA